MGLKGIYAFTVTRADTPTRRNLLIETLRKGKEKAGCKFTWDVYFSGVEMVPAAQQYADFCVGYDDNVGQHVVWNRAFEAARKMKCKYFLKIDDDCNFLSQRWLKKLVRASQMLGDNMILSPRVKGLKHPPPRSEPCEVPIAGGKPIVLEFLSEAIGGVCRLHPMHLLKQHGFEADVRMPAGSGLDVFISKWCKANTIPMAYVRHVNVRHDTAKQEEADAAYFKHHSLFQRVPYIPAWSADDAVC